MKKGFTFIQFLIIVGVIGIISLFVAPTIINLISNSKEETLKTNMVNFITAIENTRIENKINDQAFVDLSDRTYEIASDGVSLKLSETNLDLYHINYNGTRPNQGWVTIKNGNITEAQLRFGSTVLEYQNGTVTINKEKNETDFPNEVSN